MKEFRIFNHRFHQNHNLNLKDQLNTNQTMITAIIMINIKRKKLKIKRVTCKKRISIY